MLEVELGQVKLKFVVRVVGGRSGDGRSGDGRLLMRSQTKSTFGEEAKIIPGLYIGRFSEQVPSFPVTKRGPSFLPSRTSS